MFCSEFPITQKTLRGDRHGAEGNLSAEAARRRRRSPIAGFFLVGNCGKKRSVETAMGRREEGAGACLLACGKRKRASYVPERENMHTLLLENERRRSL